MIAHSNESFFSELLRAVGIQFRVIEALVLRETRTLFGDKAGGYLWAVVEPMLHIGVWFLVFSVIRQREKLYADMTPLLFLASGIVPLFFFRDTSGYIGTAIRANRPLLAYPQVRNIDFLITRAFLNAPSLSVVTIVVFGLLIYFGKATWPKDFLRSLEALALLYFLGVGFGVFNSVATILCPPYEMLVGLSRRVVYITSGIFFLGTDLPPVLMNYVGWNPVFHGLEMFRSAYSHTYKSPVAEPSYILWLTFIFLVLGLALERVFRAALRKR